MQRITVDFSKQHSGFTLVELLVVVCMVGVLASIAVPSYRSHVRKSNRAAAQSYMLDTMAREEQNLLDARQYFTGTALSVPPADVTANYTIAVTASNTATPPSCLVTATPTGDQVYDGGPLTIDCAGNKAPAALWP